MSTLLFVTPSSLAVTFFAKVKEEECELHIATDMRSIKAHLEKYIPIAIISRPQLPGYRVEELFEYMEEQNKSIPIIVCTDMASVFIAKKYLDMGAVDFWEEPLVNEQILSLIHHAHHVQKEQIPHSAISTLGVPQQSPSSMLSYVEPIGSHPAIKRVLSLVRRIASSKATILINGESGTGKEVFAKYIHMSSDRANKPFVAVNCAALPEHLLESELFGHEKGSFTGAITKKIGKFELAHGGTILLDEISEMAIGLQAKLLRVLQEGEIDRVGGGSPIPIDVRVIATTNRHLEEWVAQGHFRQDLYFRLNVVPLTLPPLRERTTDIIPLAQHFLSMYAKEYGLHNAHLSEKAIEWLQSYQFVGNVRELQNLIERAVLLSGGEMILPEHFLIHPDSWSFFEDTQEQNISQTAHIEASQMEAAFVLKALIPLHEMERIMILKGLETTSGNRTHAAELLGISVRTLRNKINEYRASGYHID